VSHSRIKVEHNGAKNRRGYYGTRFDAKTVTRKLRRSIGKAEIRRELGRG
jgi:exonuclease III